MYQKHDNPSINCTLDRFLQSYKVYISSFMSPYAISPPAPTVPPGPIGKLGSMYLGPPGPIITGIIRESITLQR